MRKILPVAAASVAVAALVITGISTANTRTKTEHFSLIDISTGPVFSAIATGDFDAGGTYNDLTHTLHFPSGTIKFESKEGAIRKAGADCPLLTESASGSYTIEGGTGAYKGIRGSGTTTGKVIDVDARGNGTCSSSNSPTAIQIITTGSGPVSLP